MIEKLLPRSIQTGETLKRSIVKTVSYRLVILLLDFGSIYLFTRQLKIAVGFMVISNVYTTIGYFLHERIWEKIRWGRSVPAKG